MEVRENSGIYLTLKQGATAAVEYDGDLYECNLVSEDKDQVTFRDVKDGLTKDFALEIKGKQNTSTGSLWRLLWDNPGAEFLCVYGANGNAVATEASPHVLGVVKATGRPQLGGAAGLKAKKNEFESRLEFIDGPELDEGA